MNFSLHSIPYDIANSMFEIARQLVASDLKGELVLNENQNIINSLKL